MKLALILFGLTVWLLAAIPLVLLARKHQVADWLQYLTIAVWPVALLAVLIWVVVGLVLEALYSALRWSLDQMDRLLLGGR